MLGCHWNMSASSAVILLHLLLVSASGGSLKTTHWFKTRLSDLEVQFQGHKATYERSTVTSCAYHCTSDPPCLSFSLHKATRRCYTFSRRVLFGMGMQRVPGYSHYWLAFNDCPTSSGYTYIPSVNVCYKAMAQTSDRLPWINASEACQEEDGHLYIANTPEKLAVITGYLVDNGIEGTEFKMGGNDLFEEGWFLWDDGSEVTSWYTNQPDDLNGDQHCMENTRNHPDYNSDGKCSYPDRYICQIPIH